MSSEHEPAAAADAAEHPEGEDAPGDASGLTREHAALAYRIIQSLLTHATVTQDLVALMAQVLDQETQDALVNTPHWSAYIDSRRAMEQTRADIEKFAEVWTRLAED